MTAPIFFAQLLRSYIDLYRREEILKNVFYSSLGGLTISWQ